MECDCRLPTTTDRLGTVICSCDKRAHFNLFRCCFSLHLPHNWLSAMNFVCKFNFCFFFVFPFYSSAIRNATTKYRSMNQHIIIVFNVHYYPTTIGRTFVFNIWLYIKCIIWCLPFKFITCASFAGDPVALMMMCILFGYFRCNSKAIEKESIPQPVSILNNIDTCTELSETQRKSAL